MAGFHQQWLYFHAGDLWLGQFERWLKPLFPAPIYICPSWLHQLTPSVDSTTSPLNYQSSPLPELVFFCSLLLNNMFCSFKLLYRKHVWKEQCPTAVYHRKFSKLICNLIHVHSIIQILLIWSKPFHITVILVLQWVGYSRRCYILLRENENMT